MKFRVGENGEDIDEFDAGYREIAELTERGMESYLETGYLFHD